MGDLSSDVPRHLLYQSLLAAYTIGPALNAYALLPAIYIGRQLQKFRTGLPLNTPKVSLLSLLVPLQRLAFLVRVRFRS